MNDFLLTLAGVRINDVQQGGDLEHHAYLTNATQRVGQLGRQAHHVVLAHGDDLDAGGVLVVEDVGAHVVGDELLSVLGADGDGGGQELGHFSCLGIGGVEKVKAGWKVKQYLIFLHILGYC